MMTGMHPKDSANVPQADQSPAVAHEVEPGRRAKVSPAVRREGAACDALRTYVRDLYFSQFGARTPSSKDLILNLRAIVSAENQWTFQFNPPLDQQLSEQLQEWQAARAVYREGHVYCFRCESSSCEHGIPPDSLSVFRGYASNGMPEWEQFAQVLLNLGEERVDVLFDSKPGVVAVVQLGADLKKQQLASFGRSSRSYALLGQVIAGYFMDTSSGRWPEKAAVTLQLVETRDQAGQIELRLNALARLSTDACLHDHLAEGWEPALARACAVARKQLADLQQSVRAAWGANDRGASRKALCRIPAILRLLSESIERGKRQQIRRTQHANERRSERPVHKALDDVREVGPECFFVDEKAGTFAVCGPQGRVHIFAANGRHVTSLRLLPSAIDFRLRTHRWRAATPQESDHIREEIASYIPKKKEALPPA